MNIIQYILGNYIKILFLVGQHFNIFIISMMAAIIIGVIISIFITRPGKENLGNIILTITGAAQAIPPLAVIALVFIFAGIGAFPSIIALVVYSLVPIIFNTTSGILNVEQGIIEAGTGVGLTKRQILWKIKLPLSIPVIMAGVRSAATINIGTATIASFIGGGGLGDLIFMGIKLYRTDMIFVGAIAVGLMAILVDLILIRLENRFKQKGYGS